MVVGDIHLQIAFTVANHSDQRTWDPGRFKARAQTDAGPCTPIIDPAQGIGGPAPSAVQPGSTVTLRKAFSCAGKHGDPLRVVLSAGGPLEAPTLEGTLP